MALEDRDLRQREILPPEKLKQLHVTVIGVGAIGRQVALQLAAMGVGDLQLIDHDTVEVANLAPQGYLEKDLGAQKVFATAELCRRINSEVRIATVPERYRRSAAVNEVLFCCVDSITTRKHIWESAGELVRLFIDGRMSAEVIRVLAAADDESRRHYSTTLFAQSEAFTGSCIAKSTIYTANIAAGLMVSQLAKRLRGLPVEADVSLNLLAGEMASV